MCFYLSRLDTQKVMSAKTGLPPAKIAKTAIICYKAMEKRKVLGVYKKGSYVTPYQGAKMERGKTYSAVIKAECAGSSIGPGLHSCKKVRFCAGHMNNSTGLSKCKRSKSDIIVKCVIPKGARYYQNDIEYVSNKLKIIGGVKAYR